MYSMTGYGRGTAQCDGREITVEFKSVNHRYLDVSMRLPRHLAFLEDPLRKLLAERLSRGHVDVFVNYRNTRSDARTVRIDDALLSQVREKGDYLRGALLQIRGVKSVSGLGLMLGVETEKPAGQVVEACMARGVLVLTAKNKIRLLPALNIPMALLEEAVATVKGVSEE